MLISVDRKAAQMEDRSAMVAVLKDEGWKQNVDEIRSKWKELDAVRRGGKAGGDEEEAKQAAMDVVYKLPTHPMGGSQRAVVFKTILELLANELQEGTKEKDFAKELANTPCEVVEKAIFRAKPKHYKYAAAKPWIWGLILHDGISTEARGQLAALYEVKLDKVFFAPQNTRDGPASEWMLDWLRGGGGKGKGGGKGSDGGGGGGGRHGKRRHT